MISVQEAEGLIMQHLPAPVAASRPLPESLGYCLAEAICAERDHPPFDRITHDGIAVNLKNAVSTSTDFPIECYAAAGAPRATLQNIAHCIEVATGAALPEGCDTVIPYETTTIESGVAKVNTPLPRPGHCLHFQGSDILRGEEVLPPGAKIGITETAILASNGFAHVPVWRKPAIGILATGDELVEVDAPVAAHQIRRSNDVTLFAALRLNGFEDSETAWEPDDPARIAARLGLWLEAKDVILVTGGVSRGTFDHVPKVLGKLGVRQVFHHVAQRPGKPLWFGVSNSGKLVFGLPGNPASSLTCLRRYVLPALMVMSGGTSHPQQTVLARAAPPHSLTLFVPVKRDEHSRAIPMQTGGSGDFTSLKGSDGFIELPSRDAAYESGETILFYPWRLP